MRGTDVFIVDAVRTPIGRHGGALAGIRPDDLAAVVIEHVVRRTGVEPTAIDDVIFGCANQAGEDNRNVARMAALLAGLPVEIPGATVNRLCGSGLQAVADGARAIATGEADVIIAGGVESMSRAPWVLAKPDGAFPRGNVTAFDTTLGWRLTNPRMEARHGADPLGETAEKVADLHGIDRASQDVFALESQRRHAAAVAAGTFAAEMIPVDIRSEKTVRTFTADEHPRPETSLESLARLRPAFREKGTVTAGNSSGINDGAAALLLASARGLAGLDRKPLARVVGTAVAGVAPSLMGLGPVPATHKLLARTATPLTSIDLIELNEAFAAQAVACTRLLALDPARVNVNGGAIAIGHPLGCSGARLVTTLAHQLARQGGRLGLATMCIGVGQGIAALIERA